MHIHQSSTEETRLDFIMRPYFVLCMEAEMGLCDHTGMISWRCREMFCCTEYSVERTCIESMSTEYQSTEYALHMETPYARTSYPRLRTMNTRSYAV